MRVGTRSRFAKRSREIFAGAPAIRTFSKRLKPPRPKWGAPAMAIKFGGNFEVARPPEEVYDFLTDPTKFAPLLPDFQSMDILDERHFAVKVNVGISYIKGTANVKMELAEANRPSRAQYKAHGSVAGGTTCLSAGRHI